MLKALRYALRLIFGRPESDWKNFPPLGRCLQCGRTLRFDPSDPRMAWFDDKGKQTCRERSFKNAQGAVITNAVMHQMSLFGDDDDEYDLPVTYDLPDDLTAEGIERWLSSE